jgi:hypothetical protein
MPKGGSVQKPRPVVTNPSGPVKPATWTKPGTGPQPGTFGKPKSA